MLLRQPQRPLLQARALQVRAEASRPGNRTLSRFCPPERDGQDQVQIPRSHEDNPVRRQRQGRGAVHKIPDEQS